MKYEEIRFFEVTDSCFCVEFLGLLCYNSLLCPLFGRQFGQ